MIIFQSLKIFLDVKYKKNKFYKKTNNFFVNFFLILRYFIIN